MPAAISPKVLFFDVFGTVVNWRKSVTERLIAESSKALQSSNNASLAADQLQNASKMTDADWGRFAQQWRDAYMKFTRGFDPSTTFISVDECHYSALQELVKEWGFKDLWDEAILKDLSLVWHDLEPWPDSVAGIAALNTKVQTATLSNGNVSLQEDMLRNGKLPFNHICSGEMFKAYKPNPIVYNGAAKRLGFKNEECALVAAHLPDLQAAQKCGFSAIYVEREGEESWDEARIAGEKAREWVDVWVEGLVRDHVKRGHGFLDVARELGIDA